MPDRQRGHFPGNDFNGGEDHDPRNLGYTSGFRVYPSYRDITKLNFLQGKAHMDNIGSDRWRIHNKLYDLSDFSRLHPGGAWWIEATSGQDITEIFESFHLSTLSEKMLDKYYVGEISTPRNSPYTFSDSGFYRTLKRKVVEHLGKHGGSGPTYKTHLVMDVLVLVFLVVSCTAAYSGSLLLAVLAGLINHMIPACAHNYFHQRDSWRMYYTGLTMAITVEEYRSFHILSHHVFPNTLYDTDIFFMEPLMCILTRRDKTWKQRWLGPLVFLAGVIFGGTPGIFIRTARRLILGTFLRWPEHLLTFALFPLYSWLSGSVYTAAAIWLIIYHVSFGTIIIMAMASTHHHPENFHDGDTPRADSDWGLFQLDATNDRPEYIGNFVLTSLLFGDHVLHHLFPTVDVSRLHQLYPLLFETCRQFNVPHRLYSQLEMFYKPLTLFSANRALLKNVFQFTDFHQQKSE